MAGALLAALVPLLCPETRPSVFPWVTASTRLTIRCQQLRTSVYIDARVLVMPAAPPAAAPGACLHLSTADSNRWACCCLHEPWM